VLAEIMFITENLEMSETESEVCAVSARHRHDLHRPAANLAVYQKGVDCVGIRLYTKLPFRIKYLSTNSK
jgi:hypothetical protein